ncbi:sigma-70 family RNA polymerase sigma factor [Nonomuraea cavernae]|uniref:RNA polymerase sigma factor n=1 Tax=Nonomuraea cavernae TaxID=2045107 RepID=A0A917YU37_9ACTN|nr:sigma-70 family RNA polymerase sigma factor [Nonomuraea cavernae]MCA2184915.1 sigma-70 family RNA polymerase sigma factor [Nonomuraea cavernae]GGO64845.1 RNA polymerase sigma factor [Nonomuraea cavernae]
MTDKPSNEDFLRLADPLRRELLAHCYRMLGSVHDAEDLVQETYLRAWRAYDRFEGRSSLRTWLYRIATTACLTALDSRSRRPLPTGLGAPSSEATAPLAERPELPWLEPVPDGMVGADDPATIVTSRESIRLALIAALQHLPPRQRAILILRDVLRWRAAEVAEALGTTTVAVNSGLQRARAQLSEVAPSLDDPARPLSAEQRARLDRYMAAFERYDVAAIVELLTKDAVWEMPPYTGWWQGPESIGRLIAANCPASGAGDLRLVPVAANGQPAFAVYFREGTGYHAFAVQVLTMTGEGVSHVVMFFDLDLFDTFGLPRTMPAADRASASK